MTRVNKSVSTESRTAASELGRQTRVEMPGSPRPDTRLHEQGRQRTVISGVHPEIENGRFPVKRTIGDKLIVEADIFADGHDRLRAVLLHRREGEDRWSESPMVPLVNDRWRGEFRVSELGYYLYSILAWVDPFRTWVSDMHKRIEADAVVRSDLNVGAELLAQAAQQAAGEDADALGHWAGQLREAPVTAVIDLLTGEERLVPLMEKHGERKHVTAYGRELRVWVDRERARYSTWYEMFPRSARKDGRAHGTFADCIDRLTYIQSMGFDVLYLPPIHPVGRVNRKGKNNTLTPGEDDVGSPWAIGSDEGGHKSIHPELGTLEDFRALVTRARECGIEIALDMAFQCAPDHPYVREHPEWFRKRPDGSIQCAENPPKKYEDIYPFDFETNDWESLWEELRSVFLFWIEQGVRIFRVDNPHTKAFPFWEWAITTLRDAYPETIFLAEAFTRPKVMRRLAKLGFSQSYTYFAWRHTRYDLTTYLTELTQTEVAEYMRPNFWPNTPDILTEYLQTGGRPAFAARFILAATMTANYGIYGPAFELCEGRAREFGSEEYLDSEKYQIRGWDLDARHSLRPLITRVNRIRRENPALQRNDTLRFHPTDNEQIICYSKTHDDPASAVLCVVNLDPYHRHSSWMELDMDALGLAPGATFQVHDLISDARFFWSGSRNFVELDPHAVPGHILRVRRHVRTEQDFAYYM
jgi:starch synthase (maltosyl-transferring)